MGAAGAIPTPADARAEYEAATQGLYFTKDYRTWDATIQDRLASAGERVYAWMRRRSWGYYRLYCINENGTPARQRDCAKELGLDKGKVSHTVKYLVSRGYVRTEGRLLYPVLTPVLQSPPEKLLTSTTFRHFFANWKQSHSTEFAEFEVADATIKRIKKVVFADYRRFRRAATKPGPILIESSESKKEISTTTAISIEEPVVVDETIEIQPPAAPTQEPTVGQIWEAVQPAEVDQVQEALQPYGPADRDTARRVIHRSRLQYPHATVEDILTMVTTKARAITKNAISPLAVLVVTVPKGFEGFTRPKPKADPYEAENIKLWREMIAPGSRHSSEHQEIARQCLRKRNLL